ncbi:MAG: hypothetical protein N3G22_00375 [Candidatus Micrarchaeota archaeon]|nr:hypothetical protein [Candidatus Micrarchaeota archaeon]
MATKKALKKKKVNSSKKVKKKVRKKSKGYGGGRIGGGKRPNFETQVRRATYSKTARLSALACAKTRQWLIEMGGENTIAIIKEFDMDMSDEEIAKKTGIRASDVRVVLNRLHGCGLFSYTRVRDRDSGWYSYIWKLNEEKLRQVVEGENTIMVEKVEEEPVVEERYLEKNMLNEGRVVKRPPALQKGF